MHSAYWLRLIFICHWLNFRRWSLYYYIINQAELDWYISRITARAVLSIVPLSYSLAPEWETRGNHHQAIIEACLLQVWHCLMWKLVPSDMVGCCKANVVCNSYRFCYFLYFALCWGRWCESARIHSANSTIEYHLNMLSSAIYVNYYSLPTYVVTHLPTNQPPLEFNCRLSIHRGRASWHQTIGDDNYR